MLVTQYGVRSRETVLIHTESLTRSFRVVLGPLEVEADNGPVVLGGPKERLLLALLLTRPNQVVPVETLVRGLWGEQPPPTAAKTLQSHIKRLRRALEQPFTSRCPTCGRPVIVEEYIWA